MSRRVIKAAIPADLLDKIYKVEGWVRAKGEVRVRRANALYAITRDNKAGQYVATPKDDRMTPDEYRAALQALGLTQVGAGRMLGVSARTGQTYAAEGPSGPAAFAIRLLLAIPEKDRAKLIEQAQAIPPPHLAPRLPPRARPDRLGVGVNDLNDSLPASVTDSHGGLLPHHQCAEIADRPKRR